MKYNFKISINYVMEYVIKWHSYKITINEIMINVFIQKFIKTPIYK